jgi:hypothetical protein
LVVKPSNDRKTAISAHRNILIVPSVFPSGEPLC